MKGNRRPKPRPMKRSPGARYETCKVCGLDWNISIKTVIGKRGYRCPRCSGRQ